MRNALIAAALLSATTAHAADWRTLDPENTLVIDTTKGRIVVEMRPDFAPKAVERIKLLARERTYDGLQFHRVIPNFVDQTGNPNNKDGGTSTHPDLPPEFLFRLPKDAVIVRNTSDGIEGFVGATPFGGPSDLEAARDPARPRRAWGAYCPGVAGMGRQAAETTANSEIFFMRDSARRLDRDYTVWGRVVVGLDVVRAITPGEPPPNPDLMTKVRVAADMPEADRPKVEVMDERGAAFRAIVEAARTAKGADFTVCDVAAGVR